MKSLFRISVLLLTMFCVACAQVAPDELEGGAYQTSSSSHWTPENASDAQVAQGVGFSTQAGPTTSAQSAQSTSSTGGLSSNAATALALLGLLALIIIADEGKICSGAGCIEDEVEPVE